MYFGLKADKNQLDRTGSPATAYWMVGNFESFVLGLIQGLTEFIPISSTAHVRVVPALLGWDDPGAAYSAVIQLGTLFALLVYFRKDITAFTIQSLRGIFSGRPFEHPDARMAWYLVLGTIPVSVFGLLFKDFITGDARSLYVISGSLIGLALILWFADRRSNQQREVTDLSWKDILLIGLAQSMALIPGSSRAGTTLTGGLLLGFSRAASMRISFLLGIPAIGLSGVYELLQEWDRLLEPGPWPLVIGIVVSAVSGYATIAFLLNYLKTHSTLVFVLYRIGLGCIIWGLLGLGILAPGP